MISNQELAKRLQHEAMELSQQGDNLYRIRAYRRAAMVVLGLQQPIETLGRDGLLQVPGIGKSIAKRIEELSTASMSLN